MTDNAVVLFHFFIRASHFQFNLAVYVGFVHAVVGCRLRVVVVII